MKKLFTILFVFAFFPELPAQPGEMLVPVKKSDEWGFINKERQWVIPLKYDDAQPFSEGLAAVNYFGKWGFINASGNWAIEPRFSNAESFSEGLACVKAFGKWGFIDRSGDWVIEPRYHAVSMFSEGLAVVFYDGSYRFVDKTGRYGIDDGFGNALPFSDGLAFVEKDGYKGYIDHLGNWIIKDHFDEAYSFSNGMALIGRNGKYGFINQRGEEVIRIKYEDGFRFNEGMAPVKEGGKWGYIDTRGSWVILPQFTYAAPFNEGFAVAGAKGRFGLINKAGYWVIEPEFEAMKGIARTISFKEEIEKMVIRKVYQWQLKGEFEKTVDYLDRVTKENRNKAIERITNDCIQEIALEHVNLSVTMLGSYNADSEYFILNLQGALRSMIPVPLDEALWFRDNWERAELKNPVFALVDDHLMLSALEVKLEDKIYAYDASVHGYLQGENHNGTVFDPININLPDISALELYNQPVTRVNGVSDIDQHIPENLIVQSNVFALVIGNEDYSSYQVGSGGEINVDYAEADARTFAAYLNRTFGLPKENITLLINATVGQMNQAIDRLASLAKVYDGEAELIFYYAGHGLPDEDTKEPYLIPVDVSGSDLTYALKLEEVYNQLSAYETHRVTVFLDACFSGGARSQGLLASRGVRIRPKSPFVLGNLIVFSASSGNQTAYAYIEQGHGMFTYFLLKKIQETRGSVTYGDLAFYVMDEVNKKSLLINNREQTPVLKLSPIFQNTWKDFSFLGDDLLSKTQ